MTEIISVRFKNGGKEYYFNPNGLQVKPGDEIIIETARGVEFGECTVGNNLVDEMTLVSPLRPVLRLATPEDRHTVEQNKKKEAHAFKVCEKKIAERGLDMKLVDVEYNFEGSKLLFFFTSDGRVDFRELVKDLAGVFHTRIELRQIGVRDEAKMLGGLGICGRPFCCSSFLDDFQPVSIKMAKTQNLSLNPLKISGACGRLMCCLKYEQDAYEDALKRCPKNDSLVETSEGVGTICSVNLLREQAKVRLDRSPETPQVFPCEELKVIRSGKGKRPEGYELPEQPEPRRLRGAPSQQEKPRSRSAERKGDPFGEVTANAPAAGAAPADAARSGQEEKQERTKNSRSRRNKPKGDGAAAGAPKQGGTGGKKPRPKKAEGAESAAPAPESAEAPAGGKKPFRRHRNRPGRPKNRDNRGGMPGAGGAPSAE